MCRLRQRAASCDFTEFEDDHVRVNEKLSIVLMNVFENCFIQLNWNYLLSSAFTLIAVAFK